MSVIIYFDESGDLGWSFNAPYRQGGSSRHLTISALVTTTEKKHLPSRLIKKTYQKFGWDTKSEKKYSHMNHDERLYFAQKAHELNESSPDIKFYSITVKKEKVLDHIRKDANKLYNYMLWLMLADEMAIHDHITLIPDPRSIKVSSGNSMHDYLQTQLWFEKAVKTSIATNPVDSAACKGLQFADMLAGIAQGHFEDGSSNEWAHISSVIKHKKLYF